ncbi:kynureninase [Euzebya sp.]|uniref:kynureninase n=1 Tax=Euzebya sp. TaxID=1971409 RepID=UPI00351757DC
MHDDPVSAAEADAADPLAAFRDRFALPDGVVYLDGNSLGPLPHGVAERVADVVTRQWGESLIRGWNDHGWVDLPGRVGDRIARLIGAPAGSVVCTDSTSVNVAKALSAALALRPDRRIVVSDRGNFPTDLYVAQGLIAALGGRHELRVVDPTDVADVLTGPDAGDVAALLLTHVDYRTGRVHDMAGLTAAAHQAGALAVWDLAHSAGAVELDLDGCDVDLAVGCSYKYLNGGPGAPAFIHVHARHADVAEPLLAGWFGHAAPFDFDLAYRPTSGVGRFRVGTPPVLAMSALDAALAVWDDVDAVGGMAAVRAKSVALTERFIAGVEARCAGHDLRLVSPRDPAARGSQVSLAHPEGYAVVQALIADGVIGDFRAPDVMRFGFAPLYLRHADVDAAVEALGTVLDERRWDTPAFRRRAAVT